MFMTDILGYVQKQSKIFFPPQKIKVLTRSVQFTKLCFY